jgi:hypothetical protein
MAERCGHCGREGTVEHVTNVVFAERQTEINWGARGIEEVADHTVLYIERCSVCGQPTLSTYRWIDGWSDPGDLDFNPLFPRGRDLADLPERVRDRYAKMLELLHAPDAFAVRAGRLLEAVCADQGIGKGDLKPRIDKLVSGGAVPQALADQAHLVRDYRNLGGHDDDHEVEAYDVPLIRGFVEALLDYLYWGPGKLARGRAALTARRNET